MDEAAALRAAIGLIRVPSRVRRARMQPLPEGVTLLLRVAAADPRAESQAFALINRPPAVIREAAFFFIEQILLSADGDSYRCLGATSRASNTELRRNLVLLLKGLHPDTGAGDRALYARRVTAAWDQLKTKERRAAYDAALLMSTNAPAKKRRIRHRSQKDWPVARCDAGAECHNAASRYNRTSDGLLRRTLRLILTGPRS